MLAASLLQWFLVASFSFAFLMKLWGMRDLTFMGSCSCLCRTTCVARPCPVSEWEVGNYVSGGNTKIIHNVWACNTLLVERSFFLSGLRGQDIHWCVNSTWIFDYSNQYFWKGVLLRFLAIIITCIAWWCEKLLYFIFTYLKIFYLPTVLCFVFIWRDT